VLGNLLDIGRNGVLRATTRLWREYGDIFRLKFGRQEAVVLIHPEQTRHVFLKNRANYRKGRGVEALTHFTGNGLFTADGELWQVQRRMMQPHFTITAVRAYAPAMQTSIAEATERLAARAGGGPVDMQLELMRFTMDVICRTMFSMGAGEGAATLSAAIGEAMHWVGVRGTQLLRLSPRVPTPANLRFLRALVEIDRFLLGLIAERQRAQEVGARGDLLDVLLQASDEETGRGMSTQQVRDEMVTTFLAGHETTAVSLGWALYLLTQHREAQEMVRAEVDAVLGGRTPAIGDLAALPATRRVIEEALRLFPPVWINPRQAIADDEIDGKRIPAGAMVLMLAYVTHRHPEFWPEPERFDPGRFTPEQVQRRHPLAFQPFGGGSRVCIGMNFALQEMVLFLAAVVQRFSVRLAPGYMFGLDEFSGTLRSRDPLLLEFEGR
jgi:cytochrome P450